MAVLLRLDRLPILFSRDPREREEGRRRKVGGRLRPPRPSPFRMLDRLRPVLPGRGPRLAAARGGAYRGRRERERAREAGGRRSGPSVPISTWPPGPSFEDSVIGS